MIKKINLALTNACNLHCTYCQIWKERKRHDLSCTTVKKILISSVLSADADIALTGGEPFLCQNLFGVTRLILDVLPNALKVVATNGTQPKAAAEFFRTFQDSLPKDFSLHISFDGMRAQARQRGGSPKQIIDSLLFLRGQFPRIPMKLKFTITPVNIEDIMPAYRFAREHGFGFKVKLLENAPFYTNKMSAPVRLLNPAEKKSVAKKLLKIYYAQRKSSQSESFFIKNIIHYLLTASRATPCDVPWKRIFVMPNGMVYSCLHCQRLGSIYKKTLEYLWRSPKAEEIRSKIRRSDCRKCVAYHGF